MRGDREVHGLVTSDLNLDYSWAVRGLRSRSDPAAVMAHLSSPARLGVCVALQNAALQTAEMCNRVRWIKAKECVAA